MSKQIKVSVLTPIYNHKIEYVRECLESLRAQTMQDIEFILIDNGATDEAKELISIYEQVDWRFRCIHIKENKGYGRALNVGLKEANGMYIAFADSDDWVEPDMYEVLYQYALTNNADIIKGSFYLCYENKERVVGISFDPLKYNKLLKPQDIKEYPLKFGSFWSAIYKKEMLFNNKISFEEVPSPAAEDIMFILKTYFYAKSIYLTPHVVFNKRMDNPNSTMQQKDRKIWIVLRLYKLLEKFIKKHEFEIDKALLGVKTKREYLNFYWGYKNDLTKNKLAYILEYSNLFRYNIKRGHYDSTLFNEKEITLFKKIAYQPICFYIEPKLKKLISNIFSVKNNDRKTHKIITLLGIKFNLKRLKPKEDFEQKLRSILREEVSSVVAREVSQALCVQKLHMQTFPQFKNIHNNQSVAIVGCGPSIKYYNNELDAVNIALNKAIFFENIKFDYLFTWDYLGFLEKAPDFFDRVKKYNCKKFYGRFLADNLPGIPEFPDDKENNIYHFYSSARHKLPAYSCGEIIHYDIETHPLADFMSISFGALHFALYTRPKKIYLIGLDTQNCGHYAGDNNTYNINKMMLGYKKFKAHIQAHYPDVEIISVNPVGLKGMFRDVYTRAYVDAHTELFDSLEDIEILDNAEEKEFCQV